MIPKEIGVHLKGPLNFKVLWPDKPDGEKKSH